LRCWVAVDVARRELAAARLDGSAHPFEVVDGEIEVVGQGSGLRSIAVALGVDAREDGPAAVEVVPAGRDALPRHTEHPGIKGRCSIDTGDLNDDAKELWSCHAG